MGGICGISTTVISTFRIFIDLFFPSCWTSPNLEKTTTNQVVFPISMIFRLFRAGFYLRLESYSLGGSQNRLSGSSHDLNPWRFKTRCHPHLETDCNKTRPFSLSELSTIPRFRSPPIPKEKIMKTSLKVTVTTQRRQDRGFARRRP